MIDGWCVGGVDHSDPLFPVSDPLSPVFSHFCALFCTFLHLRKSQIFSFHGIAHSSTKNRGEVTPAASTLTPARITQSGAQVAGTQVTGLPGLVGVTSHQ